MRAQRENQSINVKARKAVVLTCGGFENNQQMIRDYLPGVPYCYTSGTPYNEGDGITMAMSVGADLWHMNNYAGPSMALKVPEIRTTFSMQALHYSKTMPGGMIVVGPDARRFTDEKYKTRHGKVPVNGRWLPLSTPCPMFLIFDHTLFSAGPLYDTHPSHGWTQIIERYEWSEDNSAELAKGWIKAADNLAALAAAVGLDANTLVDTVSRWNRHCDAKHDADFGRTLMRAPIVDRPFYAVELSPSMLNTQGGPRRNEKGQIVRPNGTPIARLSSTESWVRSMAICIRAPEISGSAWRFAAFQGAMQRLKRLGSWHDRVARPRPIRAELAEDRGNRDSHPGQKLRLQNAVSPNMRDRRVLIAGWCAADFHFVGREVHNPNLRNAMAGIERSFHVAVIGQTGIGDLYDEQHVHGTRRRPTIIIGPWLEHREIGLRFGEVIKSNGILHRHDAPVTDSLDE